MPVGGASVANFAPTSTGSGINTVAYADFSLTAGRGVGGTEVINYYYSAEQMLFAGGYAGGLYNFALTSTTWQDVNATTPADDVGEAVGLLQDIHATETFSTFYTSDFSAGVDSFVGVQCTAAGNIDGVLGRDNCLRGTVGVAGGDTYLYRDAAYFGTTRNRTIISVYVPAAQTYVNGFEVYAGTTSIYNGNTLNGSWVDVDITAYSGGSTRITIFAKINSSYTISALAVGELFYVRAVTTSVTNLLNLYQGTAAAKPTRGVIPRGGRRNRLSTNMMTGAVAGTVGTPPCTPPLDWLITTPSGGIDVQITNASFDSNGKRCIAIRYVGTAISTLEKSVYTSLPNPSGIPASQGQSWSSTIGMRVAGGSLTGVTISNRLLCRDSAGTTSQSFDVAIVPTGAGIETQSFYNSCTLVNANSAFIQHRLRHEFDIGVPVDVTIWYSEPQTELAAAPTQVQLVTNAYTITETGVPSIPFPYFDGGDYWSTGVQSFGGASLFADAGQAWSVGGAFSTFVAGNQNLLTKCSATDANRTFQFLVTGGANLDVNLRGTVTPAIASAAVNDGRIHAWLIVWDGTTATAYIDSNAGVTLSVGAASQETQNILIGARTESAPAGFMTGFLNHFLFLNRAMTTSEIASWRSTYKNYLGSP